MSKPLYFVSHYRDNIPCGINPGTKEEPYILWKQINRMAEFISLHATHKGAMKEHKRLVDERDNPKD